MQALFLRVALLFRQVNRQLSYHQTFEKDEKRNLYDGVQFTWADYWQIDG